MILDRMEFCCGLGNKTDNNERSCPRRMDDLDIDIFEDENVIRECKITFLKCCIHKFGDQGKLLLCPLLLTLLLTEAGPIEKISCRELPKGGEGGPTSPHYVTDLSYNLD